MKFFFFFVNGNLTSIIGEQCADTVANVCFFSPRWKAHEDTVSGVHCVPACIFGVRVTVIFSYALLSAMSVISSENPSDEAWTAFQGYSFGLQNPRSLFVPMILVFSSLN